LDSLHRAGWETPHIFADRAVRIAPRHETLPITVRQPEVGAWPNYSLGLIELLMRQPGADAYLMVQDDILFYDRLNLRSYLEQVLWPTDPPGIVSLYCSAAYSRPAIGWHKFEGDWVWGALAFVFPRDLARQFACQTALLAQHWSERNDGNGHIDSLIGRWASRNDVPVFFPCPSLAQHIGDFSSLWPSQRAIGHRRADRFLADLEPD
jgi:hypothetical protein